MDSSGSGQGPVEGSCEHSYDVSGSVNVVKFLSSSATSGFSRRTQSHGVCYVLLRINEVTSPEAKVE
jgi:hypothetical protein